MIERGLTQEGSLLLTLEEISQLVSHSHNPGETLANIVELIQRRFGADACSVYLLEPERGELVLGATVGLKPDSVGRVRMRLDEGLTGLTAQQMTPVMESDASRHPRFKYFPEAGEDPYHSFLGIPLVEGGTVQGVLVIQTLEPRTFSPNEIRVLVTVGSQLAPLVGMPGCWATLLPWPTPTADVRRREWSRPRFSCCTACPSARASARGKRTSWAPQMIGRSPPRRATATWRAKRPA